MAGAVFAAAALLASPCLAQESLLLYVSGGLEADLKMAISEGAIASAAGEKRFTILDMASFLVRAGLPPDDSTCTPEPTCLDALASKLGVQRALQIDVTHRESSYEVLFQLRDTKAGLIARLTRVSPLSQADLFEVVASGLRDAFKMKPGALLVSSTPSGAEVSLDKRLFGTTGVSSPLRIYPVPVGKHKLTLKLPGHQVKELVLEISGGEVKKLQVEMIPGDEVVVAGGVAPETEPETKASKESPDEAAPVETKDESPPPRGPAVSPWVSGGLLAAGVVMLGVGIYFGLEVGEAEEEVDSAAGDLSTSRQDRDDRVSEGASRGETAATLASVFTVVGSVSALAGGGLLLWQAMDRPRADTGPKVTALPGQVVVRWQW